MSWTLYNWAGDKEVFDAIAKIGIRMDKFDGGTSMDMTDADIWYVAKELHELWGINVMVHKDSEGKQTLFADTKKFNRWFKR